MRIPGVQKSEGIKFHYCSNRIQLWSWNSFLIWMEFIFEMNGIRFWNEWNLSKYMRIHRAGLRAGYQLWGFSSAKADIHRKNNYCVSKATCWDNWRVINMPLCPNSRKLSNMWYVPRAMHLISAFASWAKPKGNILNKMIFFWSQICKVNKQEILHFAQN
jgi:hypothetical protein